MSMHFDPNGEKPKPVLTPRQSLAFRVLLIVIFVPHIIWHIGKTFVKEFRSTCWVAFWLEPRIYWSEWIDAFRRGQP